MSLLIQFPLLLSLMLGLIACSNGGTTPSSKNEVLSSFEKIAAKLQNGFEGKMILMEECALYWVITWQRVSVSYDVRQTSSLVSPFIGVITIKGVIRNNMESTRTDEKFSFTTRSKALEATAPEDFDRGSENQWTFNYPYQNGKWVFTNEFINVKGTKMSMSTAPENRQVLELFRPGDETSVHSESPGPPTPRKSVVTSSIAGVGQTVFNRKGVCFVCHGKDGDVNTVDHQKIRCLNPQPSNLRDSKFLRLKTDEERYRAIKYGIPGTAMVAGAGLTDDEISALIAYLRELRDPINQLPAR